MKEEIPHGLVAHLKFILKEIERLPNPYAIQHLPEYNELMEALALMRSCQGRLIIRENELNNEIKHRRENGR